MFDHEYDRYQSDSDLERQMHADENKARSDLGYPVVQLHRSKALFEPHQFVKSQNPRVRSCLWCGRSEDHSIHQIGEAA